MTRPASNAPLSELVSDTLKVSDTFSARVPQRRRDPRDRSEQRQLSRLVARAMPAQELDLHRVHRIDVRIAELDRATQDRLALEQPRDTCGRQNTASRPLVL